ncbi:MAG: hypothetical protein NTX44_08995 [Ignavibacteriales bacterium]|nr:hypothetical protein [Ignavibacteriales bacterium]
MGQQQIIILVLGTIIIGIALAVGILWFQSNSISSNKDALIGDLNNILADAHAYYLKPACLGGGNHSFIGYTIPRRMKTSDNGTISFTDNRLPEFNTVFVTATSSQNDGVITAKIDIFHTQLFAVTPKPGTVFDDE